MEFDDDEEGRQASFITDQMLSDDDAEDVPKRQLFSCRSRRRSEDYRPIVSEDYYAGIWHA